MNSGSELILDWMRKRQIEMAEEQESKSVEGHAGPGMTRRSFTVGAALATLAAGGWMAEAAATSERNLMLAGTQTTAGSKGIYAYHWDASTGMLSEQAVAAEAVMPTFLVLAPDGQHVYSANELVEGPGRVTAFRLDRAARKLIEINTVTSKGAAPCHVAVDRTGHALFAANYNGGSAASFQIAGDGRVSEVVSLEQFTDHGPNKERQEAAHAHRVTLSPDNRLLLVNDLGGDAIHVFRLDPSTAKLTTNDPPAWKATPGSGPRSLRFHPNGRWAYNLNEMACTAELLEWNAKAGTLTSAQQVAMLPSGPDPASTASESAIDRHGEFAYFAVRGADILVTCRIDPANGKLTVLDRQPCGGKVPRHITLDPSERWLLVANEKSGNIAVFQRDVKTGKLTSTQEEFAISRPQCLVFV
jgi:6-phosphogluconolactonase